MFSLFSFLKLSQIDFASSEGMRNFANDEEAKKTREEAGVLLDTVVMTPMSGDSITNYSG